jgi:hypothetical protein
MMITLIFLTFKKTFYSIIFFNVVLLALYASCSQLLNVPTT